MSHQHDCFIRQIEIYITYSYVNSKTGINAQISDFPCFKFVMTCEYEIFGKFPRTTGSVEKHSVG